MSGTHNPSALVSTTGIPKSICGFLATYLPDRSLQKLELPTPSCRGKHVHSSSLLGSWVCSALGRSHPIGRLPVALCTSPWVCLASSRPPRMPPVLFPLPWPLSPRGFVCPTGSRGPGAMQGLERALQIGETKLEQRSRNPGPAVSQVPGSQEGMREWQLLVGAFFIHE